MTLQFGELNRKELNGTSSTAQEPVLRTRYDARPGLVVIALEGGCEFAFPAALDRAQSPLPRRAYAALRRRPRRQGAAGVHGTENAAGLLRGLLQGLEMRSDALQVQSLCKTPVGGPVMQGIALRYS